MPLDRDKIVEAMAVKVGPRDGICGSAPFAKGEKRSGLALSPAFSFINSKF